jgi:hypothetical protein
MYRRFLLARDLLAEDGVLLVCINDENRSKLELLLDQALPGMRIGSFVWRCRTGGNDKGYFPDFMVKVKGRSKGDGILLIEVKGEFLINSLNTPDKALASHKLYRKPLMVMQDSGRWMTLRYNEKTDKLEPDAVCRVDAMSEY